MFCREDDTSGIAAAFARAIVKLWRAHVGRKEAFILNWRATKSLEKVGETIVNETGARN